jgi:hypothetical protein
MLNQGFLIVQKYEHLYDKYKDRYQLTTDLYALPRIDRSPKEYRIQYRGIDRDCLTPNEWSPYNLAEIRLAELANQVKAEKRDFYYNEFKEVEDFVPYELLNEMYEWLEDDRPKYETIFVKIADTLGEIPDGFISIGYEPSYFYSDHFSASCDCMMISRWHGTDNEGTLFSKYFMQLNPYGMFPTIDIAKEFLEYYLSFDWTERGDYFITEVFIDEGGNRSDRE